MSLPDIIQFNIPEGGGWVMGFARYTPTSTTTYLPVPMGIPTSNVSGMVLSKSGSTWTFAYDDFDSIAFTATCAATADGGFSLTVGNWTITSGNGTISAITSVLDAAATTTTSKASIKSSVTLFGVTGTLTLPTAGQVQSGVTFGVGGTGTTGTLSASSHPASASYALTYTLS